MKTVAVIHTTPVTIPTISALIKGEIPDANIRNLLDDSILPEINLAGEITEGVRYRLNTLLTMAATTKPDVIFCACSSIGTLIDKGKELIAVPVLRIDEPMAEKAVSSACKIGIAATLQSTIRPTIALIEKKAAELGKRVEIDSLVIDGVGNLLALGKEVDYDAQVAKALLKLLEENEVVVLAQASMARVLNVVEEKHHKKILTSPVSGVTALSRLLEG